MQLAKYHWAQLQQRECDVEYHTGRAREYLQMAADFEDLEAMYMLGVLTLTSTVDQHHLPMVGIQYLKKAADMGHARAQQELGLLLVSEEKDEWSRLAHARELFTNAAEQGMLLSKARLGKMMMLGEGGAVNKERGMELLQVRSVDRSLLCFSQLNSLTSRSHLPALSMIKSTIPLKFTVLLSSRPFQHQPRRY